MTKNIYVPPVKKNQFALLSNDEPTTAQPTTAQPTTAQPTTAQPTTAQPTTAQPPTAQPSTAQQVPKSYKVDNYKAGYNKEVDFKIYYKNTGQYQKREGIMPIQKREGIMPVQKYNEESKVDEGDGKWQYQKHSENKRCEQLKYIYLEVPNNIGELKMNNYYRLLAHHNADSNWNFNSYHHVTTLKTWEDVSKLFNTLNLTTYKSNIGNFDFFIMKNEISPLWEDEENRCGSICSIKIDTLKDGYNILKTLFINICNNTLMNISKNNVPNWNIINGVSFSCKKIENVSSAVEQDYSMIKIWFKTNYTQFDNIDKYFNDDINALLKKYSIKVRAIKPEY
jgi:hypothetical protein